MEFLRSKSPSTSLKFGRADTSARSFLPHPMKYHTGHFCIWTNEHISCIIRRVRPDRPAIALWQFDNNTQGQPVTTRKPAFARRNLPKPAPFCTPAQSIGALPGAPSTISNVQNLRVLLCRLGFLSGDAFPNPMCHTILPPFCSKTANAKLC